MGDKNIIFNDYPQITQKISFRSSRVAFTFLLAKK